MSACNGLVSCVLVQAGVGFCCDCMQMFAGNIGWAAPAGLGYALGTQKRMLVIGGDGGLQMTSGSIGDYVKCGTNAIWVCVNNDGCKWQRPQKCKHPDMPTRPLEASMCWAGSPEPIFKITLHTSTVRNG
jgi:hypothetical protein